MTKREKILCIILITVIVLLSFFFFITSSIESIKETEKSILKYENMIENLKENKDKFEKKQKKQINEIKQEEIDVPKMADCILDGLKQCGIIPQKYQVITKNENFIEARFVCTKEQFHSYLFHIEKENPAFSIETINIVKKDLQLHVDLKYKLGEVTLINPNNRTHPLYNLFRTKIVKKENKTETQKIESPKQDIEDGTELFSIVGRINEDDNSFLYIKKKNTNKLIKVNSQNIISESESEYILLLEEKQIKIRRK